MDKLLKPERLDVDPSSTQAAAEFNHWFKTFTHYLNALRTAEVEHSKLHILINLISFHVYQHIAYINDYERAIQTLKNLYVKPKNVITARHELRKCRQHTGKSLDQFVLRLENVRMQRRISRRLSPSNNERCLYSRDEFSPYSPTLIGE